MDAASPLNLKPHEGRHSMASCTHANTPLGGSDRYLQLLQLQLELKLELLKRRQDGFTVRTTTCARWWSYLSQTVSTFASIVSSAACFHFPLVQAASPLRISVAFLHSALQLQPRVDQFRAWPQRQLRRVQQLQRRHLTRG